MDKKPWARIKEETLIKKKIKDLDLGIKGTLIEPLIFRLYGELDQKGLVLYPPCFLAEEWFCPVGVPAIGIPFYLAHSRLRRLEKKYILEVEGGTKTEFMKLIRHEAGHAYSYAYNLFRKKRWRELFGSAFEEYPDTYRPRPYSRSYVTHLDNWYAQSHPDEDFAETFAIWLTPGLNWRKRFRGWRALEKIEYVDQLMKQVAGKKPMVPAPAEPQKNARLNLKLQTYLRQKRKLYEESYPDFYDRDLKRLFTDIEEERSSTKASKYLRSSRRRVLKAVAFWTKEKKYTIDQLMSNLIDRCEDLGLYVRKDDQDIDLQIASFISTLVTNYLHTGTFKRSK